MQQGKGSFNVRKSMITELLEMSRQYYKITAELMRPDLDSGLEYGDMIALELAKLNVNSHLSKEWFIELLSNFEDHEEDDVVMLYKTESEQLMKCVTALTESKKILISSSISLELH